jgi:hypothetical protein
MPKVSVTRRAMLWSSSARKRPTWRRVLGPSSQHRAMRKAFRAAQRLIDSFERNRREDRGEIRGLQKRIGGLVGEIGALKGKASGRQGRAAARSHPVHAPTEPVEGGLSEVCICISDGGLCLCPKKCYNLRT